MVELENVSDNEIRSWVSHLHMTSDWHREELTEKLAAVGERAVDPLITVLYSERDDARKNAVAVLMRIGEPAVEALVEAAKSDNVKVREAAVTILAHIRNARAVEALREILYRELAAFRRKRKRWVQRKIAGYSVVGTLFLVYYCVRSRHGFFPFHMFLQLIAGGSFIDASASMRRNAVKALGNVDDPHMVGPLASCLADKDNEIKRMAVEALKRLLPQVKATDRRYISSEEMDLLLKQLSGKDSVLTIAILKALEQIGDEKALAEVEWLAENDEDAPAEVRQAAQDCLPFLRIRAEEVRQAQTLLRASAPVTEIAPDTLLRPAQGSVEADPNQLLRAQSAPEVR